MAAVTSDCGRRLVNDYEVKAGMVFVCSAVIVGEASN